MKTIYRELRLDFAENKTLQTIKVKQHENIGRELVVSLWHNGEPIELSSGDTAKLNAGMRGAVLADGQTCIIDYDNSHVHVPIDDNITAYPGTVHCEILIGHSPSVTKIYTATFDLDVEPSTIDSSVILDNASAASLSNFVQSTTVRTIWSGTQAQYNAIATPNDSTLYVISG